MSDKFYSQYLVELEDGSRARLPPFGKKSTQEKFLELYEALENIHQLHKNEKYFEQEIIRYHKIKKSKPDLQSWAAKNENLGANKYACFLLDYLDYDVNDKVEHLNVYVPSWEKLEIFVDRKDFLHTIDFLEIFNHLYWVQEIIPKTQ